MNKDIEAIAKKVLSRHTLPSDESYASAVNLGFGGTRADWEKFTSNIGKDLPDISRCVQNIGYLIPTNRLGWNPSNPLSWSEVSSIRESFFFREGMRDLHFNSSTAQGIIAESDTPAPEGWSGYTVEAVFWNDMSGYDGSANWENHKVYYFLVSHGYEVDPEEEIWTTDFAVVCVIDNS